MRVITSALLTKDFNAPQSFEFSKVLEVRDFLASAPRTGWVDLGGELAESGVRFTVLDKYGEDISDEVVAEGWLQGCEVTR